MEIRGGGCHDVHSYLFVIDTEENQTRRETRNIKAERWEVSLVKRLRRHTDDTTEGGTFLSLYGIFRLVFHLNTDMP